MRPVVGHLTRYINMNTKHTPGPWTARHIQGSNFAVQEFDIRAGTYSIFQKDTSAIDGCTVYCSPENAALIAAAPDMLEALKQIAEHKGGPQGGFSIREIARAAIAKAEGRTP